LTFINYRASAGSGKTYQLVLEYLSLALKSGRNDNFKHILAITFTNKAAAEMKERILSSLKALSKGEDIPGWFWRKRKYWNRSIVQRGGICCVY
jgi:superfamily I DNA/RNA helicase